MKRIIIIASLALSFIWGQLTFASTNQLFNVRVEIAGITTIFGIPLIITTNIPGHLYQFAGIKINTPGYTLLNPGVDCTPSANGYCLFAVSDTVPAHIAVSLPIALHTFPEEIFSFSMSLCLNGMGNTFSCENHTITTSPPV